MEATNQNNQTENYYVIEDVPALQTIFTAAVPPNLLAKLDKRSLDRKSKANTTEKQEKAENYRKQKLQEQMQKAQVQESKTVYAKDWLEKGPMYQEVQQKKVDAMEQKLHKASDQASLMTILRIQKAAEHNQKVRAIRAQHLLKLVGNEDENEDMAEQQTLIRERAEKAEQRKNKALEQKVQNALDSQNKFKIDLEAHYKKEVEQKKIIMADKQIKAEQKRQELLKFKLQKARKSQNKLNRDFRSVSNARTNTNDIVKPQQVAWKHSSEVDQNEDVEMQIVDSQLAQQTSHNVNVTLPINFKIESHDNDNKETQKLNINEDKVMYVGGNKITMSFNVDIKIEPINA